MQEQIPRCWNHYTGDSSLQPESTVEINVYVEEFPVHLGQYQRFQPSRTAGCRFESDRWLIEFRSGLNRYSLQFLC